MNRREHLLTIAAEECAEVHQRLSKALRFGLDETQPGQALNNRDRIRLEFRDLVAALEMVDPKLTAYSDEEFNAKVAKVEKYLEFSRQMGTLDDDDAACGLRKKAKPGFYAIDAEHCEICAPQEKRLQFHRCQRHEGADIMARRS